jgi:uncharacterized RDD family membrane protein YckC
MSLNPRSRQLISLPSTTGVLTRRVVAYAFDLLFIALFGGLLFWAAAFLSLFTFGLLHGLFVFVALAPLIYSTLTVAGRHGATWGMRMMAIGYRTEDGMMPTLPQAFAVSFLFYFTFWITGGLILLVALFSRRHRTLHDMLAGLVMVRTDGDLWVA